MRITAGSTTLDGDLELPARVAGIVLFAHGSGSSRLSPRNRAVAEALRREGFGTLLFDLLTRQEEAVDLATSALRFDIRLLGRRLVQATEWVTARAETGSLPLGYFGASTGAAAALVAAAVLGHRIGAVVSRGGRPDLAMPLLPRVTAPTLLIAGELDETVIELNEAAHRELRCTKDLRIVPGATHLFEEPGALEEVARLASEWFRRHLRSGAGQGPS